MSGRAGLPGGHPGAPCQTRRRLRASAVRDRTVDRHLTSRTEALATARVTNLITCLSSPACRLQHWRTLSYQRGGYALRAS